MIFAIKEWGDERKIAKDPVKNLFQLYVKFHKEAEKNPELNDKGKAWFKKLENGDKEAKRIWKKCISWSLKDFERIYRILGVKIDYALGESFYEPMLEEIIREALRKKIAKKSEGAIVIPFPNNALPPLLIQKSDKTTLYSTRDLAAIKYRQKKFKPWKIIYEVGVEQTLYFQQLFWAAELLGFGKRDNYVHIAHGMMRLPSGKMSTRHGKVIFLEDLIKQVFKRAEKVISEKNPKIPEKERKKIAKVIGLGAIKYNNLSKKPLTEIVFKWEESLNLEKNSGPYLQYSYVRAKGILRRSKVKNMAIKGSIEQKWNSNEKEIIRQLSKFPEIIEEAAEKYSPNIIYSYLINLTQQFNSFYESMPILKEEDKELKVFRLAVVKAIAQVIKNGLKILGVEVIERM